MQLSDQFTSLIVGVISGIISGVMVTIYYRRKDEQRELMKYFMDFRLYLQQLLATDFDKMQDFFLNTAPPTQFDWIRPSEAEQKIIDETMLKISELDSLVSEQASEHTQNERKHTKSNEDYIYKISVVRVQLHQMQKKVIGLGNPMWQETCNRVKNKQ